MALGLQRLPSEKQVSPAPSAALFPTLRWPIRLSRVTLPGRPARDVMLSSFQPTSFSVGPRSSQRFGLTRRLFTLRRGRVTALSSVQPHVVVRCFLSSKGNILMENTRVLTRLPLRRGSRSYSTQVVERFPTPVPLPVISNPFQPLQLSCTSIIEPTGRCP